MSDSSGELQRNAKGQFVKGASGNPAGRPVGVRSQTTQVKEFIEQALANDLKDDALEILGVAIKKAKAGDNAMIKLLLGDMLAEVRRESGEKADKSVNIIIENMTQEPVGITIDHEESHE